MQTTEKKKHWPLLCSVRPRFLKKEKKIFQVRMLNPTQ